MSEMRNAQIRIVAKFEQFGREVKKLRRTLDRSSRKMRRFAIAANRRPALIHKGRKP